MREKWHSILVLAVITILINILVIIGCKKSDVALVTNNSVGNREGAAGKVFDNYHGFLARTWSGETDTQGQHIVVFIGELPVNKLLSAASRDSSNWLSVEKKYFKEVSPKAKHAYLLIRFLIKSDDTFQIMKMKIGIASGTNTAWSPDLQFNEKERIIDSIYNNSEALFIIVGNYVDPSMIAGSTLFYKLTGLNIRHFR